MSSTTPLGYKYNPGWSDDDTIIARFVARIEEFSFLRDELARAPLKGTVQHYLLVGVRGAGKTTLLKRLAAAIRRDGDLCDHLIALSFPEELYQVKNLSDFWWAACDTLLDELDHLKLGAEAARLEAAVGKIRNGNAKPPEDAGLKLLLQTCAELKRRPVLLVDNLDLVFQRIDKTGRKLKDPHAAAYWALREALSTASSPVVIGGTVRLSEPFTDYDKAFYDFFIPKRLGKLSLEEMRQVLEHLADAQNLPEVKQRLHERPSRIEALYELTGGNLRALLLIFELLRNGPGSRAVEDFEHLMDLTTPYYKARFEDMSEQAQVIMHSLAVRSPGDGGGLRFGHTAAETGAHAGLPTGTVSAQLDILEREGLVEKSAAHGRTQYRITEQLFRLWLQMRSTRRIRQNVIGLTEFLEAMFDFEELQAHMGEESSANPLAEAKMAFAIANTNYSEPLRKGLEAYGAERLLQHLKAEGGGMGDYLPAGDLPEEMGKIMQLRERLQHCGGGGLAPADQEALLGSLKLDIEEKKTFVQALCEETTGEEKVAHLHTLLDAERQLLLRCGLREGDLPLLFCLRAKGLLPLPKLTPQDIESACAMQKDKSTIRAMLWRLAGVPRLVEFDDAAARKWLDWGLQYASGADSSEWASVAAAMRRSKCLASALQALEQAFQRGESARAWFERAMVIDETGGDAIQAEAAYRKAIELCPEKVAAWNNLGSLLTAKLGRHDEAEAAYRKAIELDSEGALFWDNLGDLLADKLGRYDEAETAYRKAIELDPSDSCSWNSLGILLAGELNRPDEAEVIFRKAIELDPLDSWPWNNLGILLDSMLNRSDEAEAAFRKAIELDSENAPAWINFGILLVKKPDCPEEAEAAFRKVIELDPKEPHAWVLLGHILEIQNRMEEALAAYVSGFELNTELRLQVKEKIIVLQTSICKNIVCKALEEDSPPALRKALERLLAETPDIAATLVGTQFIEEFLVPLLKNNQHAQAVLDAMRELGFEKHARPMMLAFEAAMLNRADMLTELEPEIQGAAKHMYERLIGKKPKKKQAAAEKTKSKSKSKPAIARA